MALHPALARRARPVVLTIHTRLVSISVTSLYARAELSSAAIRVRGSFFSPSLDLSAAKGISNAPPRGVTGRPDRALSAYTPVGVSVMGLGLSPLSSLSDFGFGSDSGLRPSGCERKGSSGFECVLSSGLDLAALQLESDPMRICRIPIVDPVRVGLSPPEPGLVGRMTLVAGLELELPIAPDAPFPAEPGLVAPFPPEPGLPLNPPPPTTTRQRTLSSRCRSGLDQLSHLPSRYMRCLWPRPSRPLGQRSHSEGILERGGRSWENEGKGEMNSKRAMVGRLIRILDSSRQVVNRTTLYQTCTPSNRWSFPLTLLKVPSVHILPRGRKDVIVSLPGSPFSFFFYVPNCVYGLSSVMLSENGDLGAGLGRRRVMGRQIEPKRSNTTSEPSKVQWFQYVRPLTYIWLTIISN
ncbi:hypothetical protein RHS01_04674 [Rhizoctonia solani]|uniref:Uncharacterized protein n=1 Tax=Rhizoctonia solani TaxID=456999 RepID=A0A8H7M5A3_9AGAM|nr:hypothetical protein RHS01_04674 [Rhizoctonia solani]